MLSARLVVKYQYLTNEDRHEMAKASLKYLMEEMHRNIDIKEQIKMNFMLALIRVSTQSNLYGDEVIDTSYLPQYDEFKI